MEIELTEIRDFLAGHRPFADLPAPVLDDLPGRLTQRYFRRGTDLLRIGERNDTCFVLRSGAVAVFDEQDNLVEHGEAGASVGGTSLLRDGPVKYRVTAIEDTLTLCLDAAVFTELARSESFATHYVAQAAARIRAALRGMHDSPAGAVPRARAGDLVTRDPVVCGPRTSIRDAATLMTNHDVSALLIVEDDLRGIVTDRDLRSRVLAAGVDPGLAVEEVMTPGPLTVDADTDTFDILLEMTRRKVHHLPVTRAGRVLGMVTSGDLLRRNQASPVHLAHEIESAADMGALSRLRGRIPELVSEFVGQKLPGYDIGRLVTAVGDALTRKVIALAEQQLGPAPAAWCLVVLGSQARGELTIGSDQDNALVIADSATPELDAWFDDFATLVVEGLQECGFRRCPGDVMATRWRHPAQWWRSRVRSWVDEPTPERVLEAQTFFDMRAVAGDATLAQELRDGMLTAAARSPRFLAQLAKRAQDHIPPLGFFRGLVVEKTGEHAASLNLKTGGLQPIVQVARLFALTQGLPELNTRERLMACGRSGALSGESVADLLDAHEFLDDVRWRHHVRRLHAGETTDDFVSPRDLSSFDRKHLKDAFEIVRDIQRGLTVRFNLQYIS